MTTLAGAVVDVVEVLGANHVGALAAAYRCAGRYSPASDNSVRQALPAGHRSLLAELSQAWAESGESGPSIALALEVALAAKQRASDASVEVVVTGPSAPAAPVRLTSEVVRQLINGAHERVMMVSYAAYQVPAIVEALDAAAVRGVRVDLVLESAEYLQGGGGVAAYAKYNLYHWPADQRDPADAKLHAKAIVVDSRDVLLTSANMTNAAYDKNIELGLLCRGGTTAQRVQKHFDALIARGILRAR